MKRIKALFRRLKENEGAQALVEYAMIIALIAVVISGALGSLGGKVDDTFKEVADQTELTDPDGGPGGEETPEPEPEPELIRLGDVPQGKIVYDATWTWNFLNAGSMSGERHVDWVVAGHNFYSYPSNSTTLLSKEVLREMAYDTTLRKSGLRSSNSNRMNPFLTSARNSFGTNFRNGMKQTSFSNRYAGDVVGPPMNQFVSSESYSDRKYLFTPSQTELGGGSTDTFSMGPNWRLYSSNSQRQAYMGSRIMGYWTRSIYSGHQGGYTVDGLQIVDQTQGRFTMKAAALGSQVGSRPATNFDSDTMVQLEDDGRYRMVWE